MLRGEIVVDIDILTPDIGIEKVEVTEILVQEGKKIQQEDSIVSVESQKSVLEIPSPYTGIVKKIYIQVGDFLTVNMLIMTVSLINEIYNKKLENQLNILQDNSSTCFKGIKIADKHPKEIDSFKKSEKIYASPNIRRESKILKINLHKVIGSGRKGRITIEDLHEYQKKKKNDHIINFEKKNIVFSNNNNTKNVAEYVTLSTVQQVSGKNLLHTWNNVPHVTQFDETDITNLDKFRRRYNDKCMKKDKNYKNLSLLPFIIKCVENTLRQFPHFNSVLDSCGKKIIIQKNINIGIVVETKSGLMVPILKNLYCKSISCIASELDKLVLKAKNNQLNISDVQDGSFTISNLGCFGGVGFTPIINSPEVCILGISKATLKAVWIKKNFLPRLILPYSISYDHRVINGADAVRFTTFLGALLQDIRNLII